jgi:RNA-binding protein 39
VQRTTERDLRKFFSSKHQIKVNEVIFLQDKKTGKHKGSAYVELRRMADIPKAVELSGQPPSFQRFPILVKASEAEKNYVASKSQITLTAAQMGAAFNHAPLLDEQGNRIEAQKVYVGGLAPSVTNEQLFALFAPFGELEKVALQMEASTGVSKGFAFLSFRDPKEGNLAIQTMSNQNVAGKPIKTGWASQISTTGVPVVTSDEFPPGAKEKATNCYQLLASFTMGVDITKGAGTAKRATAPAMTMAPSRILTVADARASLANAAATAAVVAAVNLPPEFDTAPDDDATKVGNAHAPTKNILVHNMYDKDSETTAGWEKELKEEFEEECGKYGLTGVVVMYKEPGGKIYASFDSIKGAESCACSLAGRWFDKRQLRVEYVLDDQVPK